jgi:DNA-binding MarR family transcriptional regulator
VETVTDAVPETLLPSALRRRDTFALIKLAALVRAECAETLAVTGLSQHQHAILCCLEEFGAACQKDIAVRLGIDSGDLVAFIDGLQGKGLLERQRDPRDRRRQILTITGAGSQVLREVEELFDAAGAGVLGVLSPPERAGLHKAALRVLSAHAPESWIAETRAPKPGR